MEADLTRGGCRKITLFIFVGFQTGYIIFGVSQKISFFQKPLPTPLTPLPPELIDRRKNINIFVVLCPWN
jgi:hypothetical protein